MAKKIDLNKVLITGAGGMVGSYIDFGIKTDHKTLDITNLEQVLKFVKEKKPQAIIHLASETDVDHCDKEPDHAYLVNGIGTYNMALAAREVGAKLVYISTAGVFDGNKVGPYTETDQPNPQNYYGRSKYVGELVVQSMLEDYIIGRACWIFGGGPGKDKKFVAKIISMLDRPEIKAVNDAYGSPTSAKDMVQAIKKLISEDARGLYHLSNKGSCSRFEVAQVIVDTLKPGLKLTPVGLDYFPGAYRVKNETMSSKVPLMRPWKEALMEYLETEWKK